METRENALDKILDQLKEYSKTSVEILKLNLFVKGADLGANLIIKLVLVIFMSFVIILASFGLALLVGDLIGNWGYGFLIVASVHLLIVIVMYFLSPWLKSSVNESIIRQLLKTKHE